MSSSEIDKEMSYLFQQLSLSFQRWDRLFEHGGSDPHWSDGTNLNLERNHIIAYKNQIKSLAKEEFNLFADSLPEIYYRETPQEVDPNYMAQADSIRARAKEQLALYEQDPNFRYISDHHSEVFSQGETRDTKAAGLNPYRSGGLVRYRSAIERDDLVEMRSIFYTPYEEKAAEWEDCARAMKAFLAGESIPAQDRSSPIHKDSDICISDGSSREGDQRKPSLAEQIHKASTKKQGSGQLSDPKKEEQLSLF